jgi:hypothetical protein
MNGQDEVIVVCLGATDARRPEAQFWPGVLMRTGVGSDHLDSCCDGVHTVVIYPAEGGVHCFALKTPEPSRERLLALAYPRPARRAIDDPELWPAPDEFNEPLNLEQPPMDCCKRGHPWTTLNTYIEPKTGKRRCRQCRHDAQVALRRRRGMQPQRVHVDFCINGHAMVPGNVYVSKQGHHRDCMECRRAAARRSYHKRKVAKNQRRRELRAEQRAEKRELVLAGVG